MHRIRASQVWPGAGERERADVRPPVHPGLDGSASTGCAGRLLKITECLGSWRDCLVVAGPLGARL